VYIRPDGIVTDLGNAALLKMGVAWPHLEILALKERTASTIFKVTLNGLFLFLKSCC